MYQTLTLMAKKVGGPLNLIGIFVVGGAILGGGAVAVGVDINKRNSIKKDKEQRAERAKVVYTVNNEGRSNEGLLFKAGDTFRVLEFDGDAGMIEIIGNPSNPYFVSLKFLSGISNYRCNEGSGQ